MINTMFTPQAGSPTTTLTGEITADDTIIPVDDVTILPEAPNILTMIDGDNFESIIYEEIDEATNELRQVTRGVEGTAQIWTAEQEIARNFTAKDLLDVQKNIQFFISNFYYQETSSVNFTQQTMLDETTARSDIMMSTTKGLAFSSNIIETTMLDESTAESENYESVTTLS